MGESLAKKIKSSEIKQDIELKEETYLVEGETFKKEKSVISNMAEEVSVVLTDVPQQREDDKDVQDNKSNSTLDTSIAKDDSIEEENLDFSKLSEESNIILKDEPKQRAEVQIPSTDTSEIHKEQEVSKDVTEEKSLVEKVESSELKQDIELKEETYLVEGETFKKEKSVTSNMSEEVSVVLTDVPQQREEVTDEVVIDFPTPSSVSTLPKEVTLSESQFTKELYEEPERTRASSEIPKMKNEKDVSLIPFS